MAEIFEYLDERDYWYPESLLEGLKNYFGLTMYQAKSFYTKWKNSYMKFRGIK